MPMTPPLYPLPLRGHMCDPNLPAQNQVVSIEMALDIESGLRHSKATQPFKQDECVIRGSPRGSHVPNTLVASALTTPLYTTSTEVPAVSSGSVGTTMTPQDTVYKIDIEDEQILDILPRAPFFSMGTLFKPFTFSRPSSAEGGAAFLSLGSDQC